MSPSSAYMLGLRIGVKQADLLSKGKFLLNRASGSAKVPGSLPKLPRATKIPAPATATAVDVVRKLARPPATTPAAAGPLLGQVRRTLPKPAQKPKRPEAPPKATTETKPETEQPKLTKTELLGLATIPFMLGSALGMGGGEQAPGPMEMPNYLTPVPTPEPPMFYPYIQAV